MFASKDQFFTGTRGYQLTRSLRFRASASAYLNRTFGTPTGSTKWTWSAWVKRGAQGGYQSLFAVGSAGTNYGYLQFDTSNRLWYRSVVSSAIAGDYVTSSVFRDPSSWYHVIAIYDSTNATSGNRMQFYVNNNLQTTTVNTAITLNANSYLNTNGLVHYLCADNVGALQEFFDGYLGEINFIDGQALTPSSFGQSDSATGVWVPKKYTGTYGNNGFYLPLTDTSSTTNLVKDSSGNGNNWTPNNISLTAGTTYDSMIDVPYCTGQINGTQPSGNYPTLNPINKASAAAPTNANLQYSSGNYLVPATFTGVGKYYWECSYSSGACVFGVIDSALTIPATTYLFSAGSSPSVCYYSATGARYLNGVSAAYGTAFATGVIVGIALDNTASPPTIQFYNANTAQGSITLSSPTGKYIPAVSDSGAGAVIDVNFGQRPFTYTPPSGYVALCAPNLTSTSITTSGSFTGNAASDGPFIYLNGNPTAMTINGNSVTFGTNADKLANGFKVRTSSASYNAAGSNTYSVTSTGAAFKYQVAQTNP